MDDARGDRPTRQESPRTIEREGSHRSGDDSEYRTPLAFTGIAGLDDILNGGFPRHHVYLVEGDPGAGKTTLALQFLLAGARHGERGLYVTLSETKDELVAVARSHGWSLDSLRICELNPSVAAFGQDSQYTLFHPSEVELGEAMRLVLEEVEGLAPARVVLDSLGEMRLLARDPLRFRRQIVALKQCFAGRASTVLFLDDRGADRTDAQVHTLVHGVLTLEQLAPVYGAERRRLRVVKLRGRHYRGGYHDFTIATGGLSVFPRLVAAEHREAFTPAPTSTGVPELDVLLGGGIDLGTSTLLLGAAGSGKSAVATRYALAAAERGEHAAIYVFDENVQTFAARAAGLGMDLGLAIASGRITVQPVDPAELSPGEFAQQVRDAVTLRHVRVVVIDSLNGYVHAMPEERFLIAHLHELLEFLNQRGVATLLVSAQHGLVGAEMENPIDVSYLADTVVLMRYFEAGGTVRQAISVLKKRTGRHEHSVREVSLGPGGLCVGPPLRDFEGVLTGTSRYTGSLAPSIETTR